jgi:hypothetical protein
MKLIHLFLILFLSTQIISQDIKFLDTNYGNLGEIQIDQENIFQNIVEYCSTTNSIYITGNYYQDTIGGLTSSDIYIIDQVGISTVTNIGSTDLQNVNTSAAITTWLENNYFWKIINEIDSYTIKRYNCNFVLEQEFHLEFPEDHVFFWVRPINNGELLVLNHNELHWFNRSGQKKSNFGENGNVLLDELLSNKERYNIHFNKYRLEEEEILIWSSTNNVKSHSRILKNGTLDRSFGNDGFLTFENQDFPFNGFLQNNKEGYITTTADQGLIRLDNKGDNDVSFNSFKLDERLQCIEPCAYNLKFRAQFNNGYTLWTKVTESYNNFEDGLVDEVLFLLDVNGKIIEEWGDNGLIALQNPNEYLVKIIIGKDNSIYLVFGTKLEIGNSYDGITIRKLNPEIFEPFNENNEISGNLFSIYPNPSKREINLNYTGLTSVNLELDLYDMLGKLIAKKNITPIYPGEQHSLFQDLNLSKGSYHLIVRNLTDEIPMTFKLIRVE